jgi:HEAT repeat protein
LVAALTIAASLACPHVRAQGDLWDQMRNFSVEELINALNNRDSQVRYQAAYILGLREDTRAVGPLLTVAFDPQSEVRYAAVGSIFAICLSRCRTEPAAFRGTVEPLIRSLSDESWRVRADAARALGSLGEAHLIESQATVPLIKALHDDDPNVRSFAAEALGQIGDRRAVKPLQEVMFSTSDISVRGHIANALAALQDESGFRSLITELESRSPGVRDHAATSLGKLGDKRAVEPLIKALLIEDQNSSRCNGSIYPGVVDCVITLQSISFALRELGDPRAVAPLISVISKGPNDDNGVGGINEKMVKLGEPAFQALIDMLNRNEPHARMSAADALSHFQDARAIRPLSQVLLKDSNTKVRWYAALALGSTHDSQAVQPLKQGLADADQGVADVAAMALGFIGDESAVKVLTDALREPRNHAAAKSALDDIERTRHDIELSRRIRK